MERQTPKSESQAPDAPADSRVRQMVHDLRHCLFTIRTGIQLLRQSTHDPQHAAEILASMDSDERRAAQLIDELIATVLRRGSG